MTPSPMLRELPNMQGTVNTRKGFPTLAARSNGVAAANTEIRLRPFTN